MHQDIGIVHTYRRSDGLSTIPYDPNTLTCQSSNKKITPRDPPNQTCYISSLLPFPVRIYPEQPTSSALSWPDPSRIALTTSTAIILDIALIMAHN